MRRYRLLLTVLAFDLVVLVVDRGRGLELLGHTWANVAQMLAVIPPVFILLGLLDAWVPREMAMRFLGDRSGVKGVSLAIALGALAAGPLYAAFPIAAVMANKGVRYRNIIVFLGAWSTLKVPMFLFETAALGPRFSVARWLVSLAGIIIIADLMDRLTPEGVRTVTGAV